MKIMIRVDGNSKIGMGNVYRSLALAGALRKEGHEVNFIMKGYPGAFELVKDKGFVIFLLSSGSLNGSLNSHIAHIVRQNQAEMIINDIKDTDKIYMRCLKAMGIKIINFDDLGSGRKLAHILFDAFYTHGKGGEPRAHRFGPKYVVLREEFRKRKPWEERMGRPVKTITVLMGATNSGKMLEKTISALTQLSREIECHFIMSKVLPHSELFQMDYSEENFIFHYDAPNISELFSQTDLAITTAGISMCETCAIGVPTLVIPQVPHEEKNAQLFQDAGAVVALPYNPDLSEKDIGTALMKLIQNPKKRMSLSYAAQNWVDGRGLDRILDAIKPYLQNRGKTPPL